MQNLIQNTEPQQPCSHMIWNLNHFKNDIEGNVYFLMPMPMLFCICKVIFWVVKDVSATQLHHLHFTSLSAELNTKSNIESMYVNACL